jgi:hypothetical protein
MKKILILIAFGIIILPEISEAQRRNINLQSPNKWTIGLTAGATTPYHDIRRNEYYNLADISYNFGVQLGYWLGPAFGVRGNLSYGSVTGVANNATIISNYGLPGPVESTTSFFDGSIVGVFNFSGMTVDKYKPEIKERNWGFYGFLGFGAMNYTASLRNLNTNQFIDVRDAGKGSGLAIVIPMGLGVSYKISPKIHLDLEAGLRHVNADNFDAMVVQKSSGPGTSEFNFGRKLDKVGNLNVNLVFHLGKNRQGSSAYWSRSLVQQAYAENSENLNILENKLAQAVKTEKAQDERILALEEKLNALERQLRMSEVEMKKDSDGDGVPDVFDKEDTKWDLSLLQASLCGWTEEEMKQLRARADRKEKINVDGSGVALDVDKDGIPDHLDKCPTVPGLASCHGCKPETKPETVKILTDLQSLEFESGKSDFVDCGKKRTKILQDECAAKQARDIENLESLVAYLNEPQSRDFKLRIIGHTDDVGNAELNMSLSTERANSVKARLVNMGVAEDRIIAEGRGEDEPKFGPSGRNGAFTEADRTRNRRIEFVIE